MSAPPLRFDGAFVDGPLSAPPPGQTRVMGQTLSPGAQAEYEACEARWQAQLERMRKLRTPAGAEGPPPAWARVVTPLDDEAELEECAVLKVLQRHFKLPLTKVPVHRDVEVYAIEENDSRIALRGQARYVRVATAEKPRPRLALTSAPRAQRGVCARAPLPAGVLIGCLRSTTYTSAEWESMLKALGGADVAALERELALRSFSFDYARSNDAERKAHAPLVACAHGVADAVGCVNDARGSGREPNCVLLEVAVRGWPLLALLTRHAVLAGEELLRDYGSPFWAQLDGLHARLLLAQRGSAAPAERPGGSGGGGGGGAAAADVPFAWASFGNTTLMKGATELCPLVAHVAAPAGQPPRWALLERLVMMSASKGDDVASALAPMLRHSERHVAVLLSPAACADARARERFAKHVQLTRDKGKAARCDDAAAGGRGAYLVACGAAFADAQLAAAPAELPVQGPYLYAMVLLPGVATPRSGGAAAAPVVAAHAVHQQAPPAAAAAAPRPAPAAAPPLSAAPSLSAVVTASGFDDDDVATEAALSPRAAPTLTERVHAFAEAALWAAHPRGMQSMSELIRGVREARLGVDSIADLGTLLNAANHRFEVVPQFFGRRRLIVYLLRPDASGQQPVRVTPPPPASAAERQYGARVLAWLRAQGRWCTRREVLVALPPPQRQSRVTDVQFLNACVRAYPDDVAVANEGGQLAALGPRGAVPSEAPPPAAAAQPSAPPPLAAVVALSGFEEDDATPEATPSPHAAMPMLPLPPQQHAQRAMTERVVELVAAALLAARPVCGMCSLSALFDLLRDARIPEAPSSLPELGALLSSAPHRFQLVQQFFGSRRTMVYLLHPGGAGGWPVRVTPPHPATPAMQAYAPRLLTWLRVQARWCTRDEVLAALPPPPCVGHAVPFLKACVKVLADDVAVVEDQCQFAAMGPGGTLPSQVPPPLPSASLAALAAHPQPPQAQVQHADPRRPFQPLLHDEEGWRLLTTTAAPCGGGGGGAAGQHKRSHSPQPHDGAGGAPRQRTDAWNGRF